MQVIAQVIQHLRPGGIERLAIDMMKHKQSGTEVFVIALEGERSSCIRQWPELDKYPNQLIFLDKKSGFQLKTILSLRDWIKKLGVSRIHTHHVGPLLYAGLATLGLHSIKHIHTEHDAWHLSNNKQRSITLWMLKLKSIILVADAKTVAGELPKYLGELKQLNIIVNGIDTERFTPRVDTSENNNIHALKPIIIGCAARLVPEKSISTLLKAITDINNCSLVIAGDGPDRFSLEELSNELGLSSRVSFIGHIDDMVGFYQSLDIFILTSQYEGLPLSLLEAQSCGVPVICSDVGAVWEGVCKVTGTLVPNLDPCAFNHALREKMSTQESISPRDFVINRFNIHHMIHEYNSLN